MDCPSCGRECDPEQRYCNGCGHHLQGDARPTHRQRAITTSGNTGSVPIVKSEHRTGPTDPTNPLGERRPHPATDPTPIAARQPPRTQQPPLQARAGADHTPGETGRQSDWTQRPSPSPPSVPATAIQPPIHQTSIQPPFERTTAQPAVGTVTAVVPTVGASNPADQRRFFGLIPRWRRFRLNATVVFGFVAGILMTTSVFLNLLTVSLSANVIIPDNAPEGFRLGHWTIASLGSNLTVAVLLCAAMMIGGAIAAGFRLKWGGGLAAGSGLAYIGIAALAFGLVQFPILAARDFAKIPTPSPFNVIITRDVGYWMLFAASAVCVIVVFASLNECISDRQRNLNPWLAAAGALATVATVAGALTPTGRAVLSDNWYIIEGVGQAPAILVAARLVQLGLLLFAGVVGFLLVRPYGLGMAIGGTVPSLWLGLSVLIWGDGAVGPGWRNPGMNQTSLHGVTIIGLAALLCLLVLAGLSAYNQYALRTNAAHQGRVA